jgi:hypothetical protein
MRLAAQRYRPMSMPASRGDLLLGGDERTRTADPLLAKQVLYQLSYVPLLTCVKSQSWVVHRSLTR